MVRTWGPTMARRIGRLLHQLEAAETLQELATLPQVRCHELRADRAEQISFDLVHPLRLLAEVAADPIPRKPDGGLDWSRITALVIIEVADTH